jgi:hypothetical protein
MLACEDSPEIVTAGDAEFDSLPTTWTVEKLGDCLTGRQKITAVTEAITTKFDEHFRVRFYYGEDDEFNNPEDAALDPQIGDIHVSLPLNPTDPHLSDLTARFDLYRLTSGGIVLGLVDIHVL